MHIIADIVVPFTLVTVSYAVCLFIGSLYRRLFPHLRYIRGPKNPNLLYGNFIEIAEDVCISVIDASKTNVALAHCDHP